jgi:hypothetical protein
MNPYKYRIVEWSKDWPYGINNRIVASAATLKGCLSIYRKHLDTFRLANIRHNPVKTVFYCDDVPFDLETMQ